MKLNEIRKTLNDIIANEMDYAAAQAVWRMEEIWSAWNSKKVGEYREVIEDRLYLAHTKRVQAGF